MGENIERIEDHQIAYLAAILCLSTTARGCELKGLQWSDIDLFQRTITIRKTKTAAGERMIPLTSLAASALARLRTRAESFGPVGPSHSVFAAFIPSSISMGQTWWATTSRATIQRSISTVAGRRGGLSRRKQDCRVSGCMTFGTVPSRSLQRAERRTAPSWRLPDVSAAGCRNGLSRSHGSQTDSNGKSRR